ncbi:hypothetical protein [Paraclostridium sordellii]|uniref:hypothetical protein n=1 Tax=Paraclostridium sordellii TaxID=1505 RepID=UPI000E50E266|nr:hypothetical protein [Paeniclostridium sordellii]RGX09339.1 hypothetical protein DWV40_07525 [Paeniclostridium sordellii]
MKCKNICNASEVNIVYDEKNLLEELNQLGYEVITLNSKKGRILDISKLKMKKKTIKTNTNFDRLILSEV